MKSMPANIRAEQRRESPKVCLARYARPGARPPHWPGTSAVTAGHVGRSGDGKRGSGETAGKETGQ